MRQAGSATEPVSERDRDVLRSFARRIDPSDAGAHNNLGVLYHNKGLFDEAVAEFMRAVELDPALSVARANLELAYVSGGHAAARVGQLRDFLRGNPGDRDARWELARTHALLGQEAEAIAAFTELLVHAPNDIDALIQLGLAEKAAGYMEAAQRNFEQALVIQPDSAALRVHLGDVAHSRRRHEEALTLLEQAVSLDPQNYDALQLLARVLGAMGRHQEAQDASASAVALEPTLPRAQPHLALTQAREPYGAVTQRAALPPAAEVVPEANLAHYNRGLALRKKASFAEALREYGIALQKGEDRDLVEQAMAEVHLLSRDPASALTLYDSLLQRRPESPKLWNEHGVALHQASRYLDAQQSYRRAVEADPQYALAFNNLGVAHYHAGDPDSAADAFNRALAAQPSFARARLNQALLLYKAKRLQQALEAYREVLGVDAEHPVAWNGVGVVLADLKKFAEAKSAFARAIQARPQYAEAHYNLSFTLSNLGDFEGALRETKLAIDIEPYYVAQKFDLAIDLEFEDPDLSIQPDLGQEKRVDAAIEDFAFDPGTLDSLFAGLAPAATAASPAPLTGDPFAMATDFMTKGFFDRAQAEATRALARGADRIRGGTLLGDIFARRALWGEALERYRDVRREKSDHIAAMTGEATALLRLGRAMEARHVSELLLPRLPEDVETLMLVAAVRAEAGDATGALAVLESARKLSPMRPDVHRAIGEVAWKLRDAEGAITAYRTALQIDPQYAVVRHQLASVLIERDMLFDAERELSLALDAVPTYGEAALALSRLLRRVGRPDEAMPLLIDMLQRDLYNFDALLALGETLMERGKRDDAHVAFTRVLRFDPSHAGALYYEGAIFVQEERYRDAVDRFQRVIDVAPTSEFARKARRDIKSATDLGRRYARQAAS